MPAVKATSRPSASDTAAAISHTRRRRPNGQRRRASSGSTISAAAGAANHGDVCGAVARVLAQHHLERALDRRQRRSGRRTRSACLTSRRYPTPGAPASSSRSEIDPAPSADDRAAAATVPSPHGNHRSPYPTPAPRRGHPRRRRDPQYSLRKILAVWAAAMVPMGLLAWVVAPLLADHLGGPSPLTRALHHLPHRRPGLAVRPRADPARARAPLPDWPGLPQGAVAQRPAAQARGCWSRCWPSRSASRSSSPDPPRRHPRARRVLRLPRRSRVHVRLVGLARGHRHAVGVQHRPR